MFMKRTALLIGCLPALALAARGSELSSVPAYFRDAGGMHAIRVAADELLVKVEDSVASRGERPAFLPARVTPAELMDEAVALETRLTERGLHVVRGAGASALRSTPGVKWALPIVYGVDSRVPFYMTDRVVLAAQPGVRFDALEALADSLGCDIRKLERGAARYVLVARDPHLTNPIAIANALSERSDLVEYADPDFFVPLVSYSPPVIQDPLYLALQWHLDGDVSKGAVAGSDINVEAAWDTANGPFAQGNPVVRVAILDECVEKFHPDLYPNWWTGIDYDVEPPDDDPSPTGGQKHGTSCAGVAVAKGNSIGVRGACPDCGLMGVRFFSAPISDLATSFLWCADPNNDGDDSDGATILSNSWGFGSGDYQPSDVVAAINNTALTGRNGLGCLVLFAAANNDHTIDGISALAQLPTVLAIGGTNSNRMHTEFSDVGPELAVAAPTNDRGDDGVRLPWIDITTVDNTGDAGYNGLPDLDYTDGFGGTSSATPLAAGVFGLVVSQDPNMSAAQARAIVQRTAVRIEEPYGRFDGITGHSHRLGFGRVDAGAAATAAHAGIRWPDRIKSMSATAAPGGVILSWLTPTNDYAESLLVRSNKPFAWMPADGATYNAGDVVAPGVQVVYRGAVGSTTDAAALSGAFFYGVYPCSNLNRYGFGAKAHVIRDQTTLFYDNSEQPDPGWTTGGAGNEWTRGTPTSANSPFGQSVVGSGPLAGLDGQRAISGNKCWGTDLSSTYSPNADCWLMTPTINLTNVAAPAFLEYWDWCMLETHYDTCRVEVCDPAGNLIGVVDGDTGGDYDWTRRVYDLSPWLGQAFRIRFRLTSDGLFQRDGWFIDEVRISVAGNVPLPPVAKDGYRETTLNTPVNILLAATDPNPADDLQIVITALPQHGQLSDPFGGPITTAPYTLLSSGELVNYTPQSGYQGSDFFSFRAFDGQLQSNTATVKVSVGAPTVVYNFPLDSNPGWLADSGWQFGQPQGQGGDPPSAFTGLYVYGYNLAGAYQNDMPARRLTTLPMNLSGLSRVTLRFARWLGVESSSFDSASVEVTTDGVNWQTIWNHTGANLVETAWGVQTYNVHALADGATFAQFRWTIGPTDAADVYSGWNIDDVQVLAIGTAAGNQPPLALSQEASTARNQPLALTLSGSDAELAPLSFEITELPINGTLLDINAAPIVAAPYTLPGGSRDVTYVPDVDFGGLDAFKFRVSDGALHSNVANVSLEVLQPASFEFFEMFESGPPLGVYWKTASTGTGRIRVTNNNGPQGGYHVTMDSSRDGSDSGNELTLVIDLEGQQFVRLAFDWKDFSDETNSLPASWVGSALGDGVAISADGITWHKIFDLFDPGRAETYQSVVLDLDQAAAAAGIAYTNVFRIRFQQYDNNPIPSDGIAIDNVAVIQGTSDPLISTSSLPNGRVNEPYGPVQLESIGGDHPLVWSIVSGYGEIDLGAADFAAVGVAQNWRGSNSFYSYTLPFAFPLYGQSYTQATVGVDGWINFGPVVGSTWNNSAAALAANIRVAPLWDNLRTDQPGNDIFVDASVPGRVTFRWQGVTHTGLLPVNFSATLYADGRVRFAYGSGNTGLTPTIGVSKGDNAQYALSQYDNATALSNAASVELTRSALPSGLSMSQAAVVSGTPSAMGVYRPIFKIVDQSSRTHQRMLTIRVVQIVYGDADVDGDCDANDFDAFASCLDASPQPAPCLDSFDVNADGVIDMAEAAAFQAAFTGPIE